MNKVAMVLGVAVVATLAGCKDPDIVNAKNGGQNEVKPIPAETAKPAPANPAPAPDVAPGKEIKDVNAAPIAPATPAKKTCTCAPGTKHYSPCKCGADDCMCVTEVKPVKPAEEFTVYYVQNGDYLAKISKKFNVTMNSIKRLNGMTKDTVRVGQKLKIPGKVDVGAAAAKPTASVPAGTPKRTGKKGYQAYTGATKEYVVKNGDTLGGIAYANGINIRQLKELNGLEKDALHIGQKLKIPAEKVVAPKGEAKAAKAKAKGDEKAKAKVEGEGAKGDEKAKVEGEKVKGKGEGEVKPAETASAAPAEKKADAAAPAAPADAAKPAEAAKAPAPAAEAKEAAPAASVAYQVQNGEDIQSVAIKFGITTAEIRELNNLGENDGIKAGQTIKLPADAQQ